ncbi:replication restart DNA helicase PriA [Plasticicumulans lactativorans]|uniref:Replication restart protein PriA n=1 Tax=Plasticicumulans lactativorans TaxID=1133106 RepID=A0A4R2L5K7_9GAMM|nr:primosomal protein N' [Plasticicumulans lactativorans]TCO82674.1 replication restart DNA helicase PriA [Plasticicumulans lactativorans]
MTAPILRVAVPSPLYRCFDYLPPEQHPPLAPGQRVRVPFGRRIVVGVVLALAAGSDVPRERLRQAVSVLDTAPLLDADLLALAEWAARYYHHPPGEVYATLLPAALRRGAAARPTQLRVWQLTADGHAALAAGEPRRAPRQRALLERLGASPHGLDADTLRTLAGDVVAPLRALAARGWVATAAPVAPAPTPTHPGPPLAAAQAEAVAAITSATGFAAFLLEGVTGSGKTEVYLRAIAATLAAGRQALVLVPEIGLTPQLLERFRARLPTPLAVLHSGLSDGERLNAWLAARSGSAGVLIGTRSAVFAPLARPGLIVLDEEHDPSFKQQDGFRYSARDLAVVRAHAAGIPVVLGSATPALESLRNVQLGRYRHLRLDERAAGAQPPATEVIDLRRQGLDEGLSAPLLARIGAHLDAGGQVLLFLNRRGYAPALYCHACGWLAECPRCDARMTVHRGRQRLLCHHCGSERALPRACPDCGGAELLGLGQGTERIEAALARHFPGVGVARIDRDSTRRKGALEGLLDGVHDGRHRLLIGTQMLAKGHHFPEVTLVGVVDADQGLFSADFRATERMAQTLVQVAGRAGRAGRPGSVAIQTHHPDHPLLQRLLHAGYPAFAEALLAERREAQLPPFAHQALLRAEAATAAAPLAFLDAAAALAGTLGPAGVEVLGPVPAPMERRAGRHRAQLLLQAVERPLLQALLARWVEALAALPGARQVRWSLDVDPVDLF